MTVTERLNDMLLHTEKHAQPELCSAMSFRERFIKIIIDATTLGTFACFTLRNE